MSLPASDDPTRDLRGTVRMMRWLGGALVLLSVLLAGIAFVGMTRAATPTRILFPIMGIAMSGLVPGVGLLLLAYYLRRGQFWAAVTSLAAASLGVLLGAIGLVQVFAKMSHRQWSSEMFFTAVVLPVALLVLLMAACGQLIVRLTRVMRAIRSMPPEERGFEPIVPTTPVVTGVPLAKTHEPPS